jgi:AraC-like DNA-binding protein
MSTEIKVLNYKGKVVFEKITMPYFRRMPKLFEKNEACFMFINKGEFSVRTPEEFISFKKGKGLLAKCFDYFFETNKSQRESSDAVEIVGVILHQSIMEELFQFDLASYDFNLGYNLKQLQIDALLANYKESINILLDNPEIADETLIKTKLKEFVLLLSKSENAPSELDFLSALFKLNPSDFRSTINNNLYANLTLEEFAKLCNISVSTFKRKFRSVYRESPKKYLSKMKMERASQLLIIKENRISDIAFDCGFDSLGTFNRNFKAHFGISPSEFRMGQQV